MDTQAAELPLGFKPASAAAHRAHWRRVCSIAYLLLGRRDGSYRAVRARLDALRPADRFTLSAWGRFPSEWFDELDAIDRDTRLLLRKPVAAQAGRSRRSAALADKIARLSAAYDELRPGTKRPAWIAAQACCGVSTVEKALARLRRQAEA